MSRKFFSLPLNNLHFEKDTGDSIKVKMYAISDGVNRNECEFMLDSMTNAIPSMYNKPILAYFNEKTQDTESHNTKLKLDIKTGEYYYDYNYPEAEKPVGTIPESATISIEQHEGKNWVVIDGGIIWTSYNRSLSRLIKRQLKKKVSVEIEVLDSYMEDGVEKITSFNFLGITILGKTSDGLQEIQEGIENAHMKMINFSSSDNFKKYSQCFEYAKQHSFKQIDDEGKEITEVKIPILAEIKEYISGFMNEMISFPNKTPEFSDIEANSLSLLVNEDISLDGAKILIDKLEKYMDDANDLIANMIGGVKMYEYLKTFDDREEEFIEKDKIGTGSKLKVSLTKKYASNDAWSTVNKTNLRNDLLEKSNYKDLVKKCYLVVEDDWEETPSEKLKYPVCQIKNDTLVYNVNGVQSARSRLEQNTDAPYYKSATAKLDKIYSKLGLDEDKKHMKFKEVNRQMKEKFVALFAEKNEFKYLGNTEKSVLAFSLKDNKFVIIPFEKGEDEHIEMKEEMAKDAEIYAKSMEDDEEDESEEEDKEEFGCGKGMAEEFSELNKQFDTSDNIMNALRASFGSKYDGEDWFYVEAYDLENKLVYIYMNSCIYRYEFDEAYDIKLDTKTEVRVSTEYVVVGETFSTEKMSEKIKSMEEDKAKFEEEVKKLEEEKEEMAKEVSEFKEEKFAKIIQSYSAKFAMTEEEVKTWTESTKNFSDFTSFEKELVFSFKDKVVVDSKHIIDTFGVKAPKSTNTKKSAIERLREKQL